MVLIPEGWAQSTIKFGGAAAPLGAAVVIGHRLDDDAKTAADVANKVWDQWVARILPQQTSATTLVGVLTKFGPAETGPSFERTGAAAGGASGLPTSPNVTYLIKKITGFGGRAGRGRLYLPGVTETVIDAGGTVLPSSVTGLTTAFNLFRDDMTGFGTPVVLLHGEGSPLSVPSTVISFQCDGRAATQRRRMRR